MDIFWNYTTLPEHNLGIMKKKNQWFYMHAMIICFFARNEKKYFFKVLLTNVLSYMLFDKFY